MIRIWVDDIRPPIANGNYDIWCKTVWQVKTLISEFVDKNNVLQIEEINLDHDAGDYVDKGGDYIEILNWLEEAQYTYKWIIPTIFRFHSMNPVGVANMKNICYNRGWIVK